MIIEILKAKLRAALRFFRRPPAKTMAVESPAAGTMDWLMQPAGARTWEEALGGAHRDAAAQRERSATAGD